MIECYSCGFKIRFSFFDKFCKNCGHVISWRNFIGSSLKTLLIFGSVFCFLSTMSLNLKSDSLTEDVYNSLNLFTVYLLYKGLVHRKDTKPWFSLGLIITTLSLTLIKYYIYLINM
jgi:hypothetical protein